MTNEKKARQWKTAWKVCRAAALTALISVPVTVAIQKFNDEPIDYASSLEHEINDCHRYAEMPERCSALTEEYNRLTGSEEYSDAKLIYGAAEYAGWSGLGLFIPCMFGVAVSKRKAEKYRAALDKEKKANQ